MCVKYLLIRCVHHHASTRTFNKNDLKMLIEIQRFRINKMLIFLMKNIEFFMTRCVHHHASTHKHSSTALTDFSCSCYFPLRFSYVFFSIRTGVVRPLSYFLRLYVERHSRLQGGRPINKYCRSSFPRVGSSRNNIVIGHVMSET